MQYSTHSRRRVRRSWRNPLGRRSGVSFGACQQARATGQAQVLRQIGSPSPWRLVNPATHEFLTGPFIGHTLATVPVEYLALLEREMAPMLTTGEFGVILSALCQRRRGEAAQ